MTRRTLCLLVATAVMGLAPAAGAQESRPSVSLPGFRGMIRLDTVGVATEFDATAERVMTALQEAFVDVGVQPDVDVAKGYVGKFDLKATRRFAKTQLSSLLDCGVRDKGPNADFYRVHMALLGMVKPATNGKTSLRIALAAGAQDYSGALADPVACGSSGKLEERMRAFVQEKLKG